MDGHDETTVMSWDLHTCTMNCGNYMFILPLSSKKEAYASFVTNIRTALMLAYITGTTSECGAVWPFYVPMSTSTRGTCARSLNTFTSQMKGVQHCSQKCMMRLYKRYFIEFHKRIKIMQVN